MGNYIADKFYSKPADQKHSREALGRRVRLIDLGEERELRNCKGKLVAYWAAGAEGIVIDYNPSWQSPKRLNTMAEKYIEWGFVVQVEQPGWGYFFINAFDVSWLPRLPGDPSPSEVVGYKSTWE